MGPWWWFYMNRNMLEQVYNFNYFNNLRVLSFVCISWTIKCLMLLMHGATMKFKIYITRTIKIIRTLKPLDNSSRFSRRSIWCWGSWREKRSSSDYNVSAKIRKTLRKHKDVIWGEGGGKLFVEFRLLRRSRNQTPGKSQGWVYYLAL